MNKIVSEIRRIKRHEGHSGGLDGCPLCAHKAPPDIIEEVLKEDEQFLSQLAEPAPAPEPELSPERRRLARILGDN